MKTIVFFFLAASSLIMMAGAADPFSEFLAICPYSHSKADDPIVYPGQPGASHMHDFLGSTIVNANTTVEQLLAGGTTCDPVEDKSAYWMPTLYGPDGQPVHPTQVRIYYATIHIPAAQIKNVVKMPNGLKMLTGDAMATSPQPTSVVQWNCVGESGKKSSYIPTCAGNKLEVIIKFPECWDGVRLDSPNHKDHMRVGKGGQGCPASHPVILPMLEYKFQFGVRGGPGYKLASDIMQEQMMGHNIPGQTLHADAFIAWVGNSMHDRVKNCNHKSVKCKTNGFP